MDSTTASVYIAYAEIRGLCLAIKRNPDNDGEKTLAEHILMVMDRIVGDPNAKEEGGEKMTISAKFKVQRVTPHTNGNPDSHYAEIELVPDYAGDRNKEWSRYTPSGVMRMNVSNPAALEAMTQGKAFTVLFEPNDD